MASLSAWFRLARAGLVLLRHDALCPREISHLLPPVARACASLLRFVFSNRSRLSAGQRYALAFQNLGPAFIKLGQMLSTRVDIFGEAFTRDLSHLKDSLPPFSMETAREAVLEALGKPASEIFSEFGPPLGSASIAQAHSAVMPDGRKVAVKILRPGIETIIANDIEMLRLGALLTAVLVPATRRLEPQAFVETVAETLSLELDLRLEAAAADEIGKVTNSEPYMRVPAVVWHQVSRRVIVIEWAEGAPLSRPETLELEGLDRLAIADKLIRAFLSQALNHGSFHADLHEGNLFVAAPSTLTAIDFGIVGRLRPKERRYLAEMLWGFLRRDYKRVAEVHFEAGYVPRDKNVEAFAQALRAVGEPVLGRKATEVSMGRLLTQLFEITAQFDMHLRPELVLLQKTMVSVEGVARRLYPEHDLWEAARPVVKDWIARELSPVAEMKRILGRIVSKLREDEPEFVVQPNDNGSDTESLKASIRVAVVLGGMSLLTALGCLGLLVLDRLQ